MDLKKLPPDSEIFIDTNIFLYALSDHPKYGAGCNEFFDRVKIGEIKGKISIIVVNELVHKLMIGEIAEREGIKPTQVIRHIKNNREILQNLEAYNALADIENNYNLEIWDVRQEDFTRARKLMNEKLLLSNDALHLAVMRREGIADIATRDPDFDTIEGIKIWNPFNSLEAIQ